MFPRRPRLGPLDAVVLVLTAGAAGYLAYRLKVGLDYRWNWEVIPQYLVRFDPARGRWTTNLILDGLLTTIKLSLWATILATVLGTMVGLLRVGRSRFNRLLGGGYVEMVRNLPPLVLIFIFYYFVGDQVLPRLGLESALRQLPPLAQEVIGLALAPAKSINSFLAALAALACYEGAYIAEIVRAGVQSIERGQWEASSAQGLNRLQQLRHVILPQATLRILPPLAGQFISTIKDSAIVSVISIQELTFQGLELMAATYLTFEVWITIAVLYLVLTLACSLAVAQVETRLRRRGG